jgi:osmoprotectant transport system permease protein
VAAAARNMSIPSQVWSWLTDPASYHGPDGVPWRLAQHAGIAFAALLITVVVALPIGVVLGHYRRGGLLVTTVANGARAIPILGVLIIFAVGPLGVGRRSAIAALIIFAIPPILTNAYTGVREVDRDIRDAAVGMGMNARQVLGRVEMPLALPLIAAGIRLAAVQVWATATLAALVGAGGLGQFVVVGFSIQDYGQVYGGVFYIALTSVLLELSLAGVERRLRARVGQSRPVRFVEDEELEAAETVAA